MYNSSHALHNVVHVNFLKDKRKTKMSKHYSTICKQHSLGNFMPVASWSAIESNDRTPQGFSRVREGDGYA